MDQKLLFLINREWTGPALDQFMALMSSYAAWAPVFALLVVLVLWRGGFRARAFVLSAALIVGFNDGLLARTLKHLADRPRPHQALSGVRMLDFAKAAPRMLALGKPLKIKLSSPSGEDVVGKSFPSAHTINSFSIALVCACFFRRWGWLAFLPAAAVGYSRIYTGAHWPSDVLTSLFLGLGSSLLLLGAFEWLWRKHGARLLPVIHTRHPRLLAA